MRTLRAPPLSRQTCAWEERAAPSAPRLTPRARAHACTPQLLPSLSREVPKKAVALAALLLCAGTSLLIAALALGAQGTQHATPLFVLGAVMFLPVRRAALAGVALLRRYAWAQMHADSPSLSLCVRSAGRLLHALGIQGVAGRGGL
jgi:hypothetical protein